MAKLYFRYGTMGSSKTANALMVNYNYLERGKKPLLLKPAVDTRDGDKVIRSRIGLAALCRFFEEIDSLQPETYDCIIVDEAQLLTRENVMRLMELVDTHNVPVIAYGLRTDFKGSLFEGSKYLLAAADVIEEIKTVCWCGKKATFTARLVDGEKKKNGSQVFIGGNENYIGLCREHWFKNQLK